MIPYNNNDISNNNININNDKNCPTIPGHVSWRVPSLRHPSPDCQSVQLCVHKISRQAERLLAVIFPGIWWQVSGVGGAVLPQSACILSNLDQSSLICMDCFWSAEIESCYPCFWKKSSRFAIILPIRIHTGGRHLIPGQLYKDSAGFGITLCWMPFFFISRTIPAWLVVRRGIEKNKNKKARQTDPATGSPIMQADPEETRNSGTWIVLETVSK